jgi:hypothetical protein
MSFAFVDEPDENRAQRSAQATTHEKA